MMQGLEKVEIAIIGELPENLRFQLTKPDGKKITFSPEAKLCAAEIVAAFFTEEQ